ncbi:MAG: sulfatase-like hydrolase/transferase [Phycisphaerae bacterium]|jgi:arylsulfatase A-like enzyme|nr:sulfatase-like hydrolase/transferase [Phycisphaerae bacterium]MCZ2398385.1 sulfatase-like hydrolase/transferase [Phycisphaerae bacterium]
MSAAPPSVLMIVVDCARADRTLSPERTCVTPALDALRRRGITFTTVIAETAATTPCFAGLLTGAYSARHGVCAVGGHRVADELVMLPEVLRARGYYTIAEVTGPLLPAAGLARGFDEYNYRVALDYLSGPWGADLRRRLAGGGLRRPWFMLLHLWELHVPRQAPGEFRRPRYGATPYDRALSHLDSQLASLLESLPADTLVLVTGDHGEKTPQEQYRPGTAVDYARRLYDVDRAGALGVRAAAMLIGPLAMQQLRARLQPRLEQSSRRDAPAISRGGPWSSLRDLLDLLRLAPPWRLRDWLRLHRGGSATGALRRTGGLSEHDTERRIRALFERLGEPRVFDLYRRMWTSQFRRQLHEGHVLHVYDWLVRVPLVIGVRGDGPAARALHATSGRTFDEQVRQVDVAAALLELLDIASPEDFSPDGRSFVPLVRGRPWRAAPALLSVTGRPRDLVMRGVRTEQYKYTFGPENPELPRELYDLRRDPSEADNIAGEHTDLCREMEALADSLLPATAPRVSRLEGLTADEQRTLELRLRELGYVE